jgi:[acyl-carrier-protein] S-malonyltransferase
MNKALLFSGQGSQYIGMMSDFFQNNSKAQSMINMADEILGYKLSQIMFEGPIEKLTETRYTQPALFLHSAVLFDLLKNKITFTGVAGHSVGEYAALYSSGVLTFEDALRLVSARGNLMFEIGQEFPGTMFAIVGMDDEKLNETVNRLNQNDEKLEKIVVAANFNSPGQIVISGSRDYLREIVGEFKSNGAKIVKELVVSGAFHSPLMQPVKIELDKLIESTQFNDANVSIYMNVSAKAATKSNEIRELLKEQVISSVYWTQILQNMKNDGISEFTELGPNSVLQGLVKRTLTEVIINGADKIADLEKF